MNTSDFDYHLPEALIAQEPMNPREAANLMVVHKDSGSLEFKKIADFPTLLESSDVLVLNNTKVFNARLKAFIKRKNLPDRIAELFLVRPSQSHLQEVLLQMLPEQSVWVAIGKPGKAFSKDAVVEIAEGFHGTVTKTSGQTFEITFPYSHDAVIQKANTVGSVPVPPYIKKTPKNEEYQTVYAKVTGSVAAPTAGFHLTPTLLQQIKDKGVTIVEITLHVGLGTFMPVKTDTVDDHEMHSEWVNISEETAEIINKAKQEKRRIIAVGTTTTRALEGVAEKAISHLHSVISYSGDINIFITPGFEFNIIDGLLTNFHLPKSTLLLLVSAMAGKETIKKAYQEAIDHHYRFYSFGDAMIII